MTSLLIDRDALASEIKAAANAATARNSTVAEGTASVVYVVLQHVVKRVGGEMAALRATNSALASVIGELPGRLSSIEARLSAMERVR